MHKAWIAAIVAMSPNIAFGASFDCTKATTATEKTICSNKWLGRLDEELAYYYTKLSKRLGKAESGKLRAEQRKWIKKRNRNCEQSGNKIACLSRLYQKRVTELKIRYDRPALPSHQELKNLCSELARLNSSERKTYGDKTINLVQSSKTTAFDINNDGKKEIAKGCFGGTAHVPCVEFTTPDGRSLNIDTINYEWKTYWTYGLREFRKNGRWYSFHSYDDDFERPAYVSYLTPDNNEYVVCEFNNKKIQQVIPNPDIPESRQLCAEVVRKKTKHIKTIRLTGKPLITSEQLRKQGRYETGLRRQGLIDYDNNGTPNLVGALEYASGAGRGCDFNYFDELSDSGRSFSHSEKRDLLLKMQHVDLDGRHPNCGSSMNGRYMNRFFSYKGKNYYEYRTRTDRAVYIIRNNAIHKVCNFKQAYKTTVKRVGLSISQSRN